LVLKVDEQKIVSEIKMLNPNRVLFAAPDGLLSKVFEIASRIEDDYRVCTFVLADPCYGACDTLSYQVEEMGVDLVFHVGHSLPTDRVVDRTVFIEAYDDVKFSEVLVRSLSFLSNYRKIGLCTFSQHMHEINPAKKFLEDHGMDVSIGLGKGCLAAGQVLGCEFHTVFNIKDKVDALVVLGQSRFHAVGVELATGKPTFMLDPYLNEIVPISPLAEERWKKAFLSIFRARDADRFAIILGLKGGQMMVEKAMNLKRRFEECGKYVRTIALHEIVDERLVLLKDIEAYIQTACPRISIDGYVFKKPVLSMPQAEALLGLWKGEDMADFLRRGCWR
jgi:2-(3-amino-3-carboxypropyl)histidine synthase